MSNVLSEEKKQQVIALGKLGWPLRRIEQATGVRRETAGAYLKAAGSPYEHRAVTEEMFGGQHRVDERKRAGQS